VRALFSSPPTMQRMVRVLPCADVLVLAVGAFAATISERPVVWTGVA
jgi:hypothetical protein